MRRMMSWQLMLLAIWAVPAALAAGGSRTLSESILLEPGQAVRLDFPVGELEIGGVSGDRLEIVVEARCKRDRDRCEERIEEIAIDVQESRGRLYLEVAPHSKWRSWNALELDARVSIPATSPLTVDMGVGELELEGVASDLEIDLGVGEVSAYLALAAVASVSLDAGIGETQLLAPEGWIEGERSFLIGSESSWRDGPGEARIHIEVGVGEAVVRLRE